MYATARYQPYSLLLLLRKRPHPSGLTCLHCGQVVEDVMRWLNTHWRAAHVICLDFQGDLFAAFPEIHWEAPASAPVPGSARVLRVLCDGPYGKWYGLPPFMVGPADDLISALQRWVAGVASLCQHLTVLHLRGMKARPLPALPLLVHVILAQCTFTPALVASLQGLARLETLHVSGDWGLGPPAWDVCACTRLRRVHMGWMLARGLLAAGQELCLPPACTVALEIRQAGGVAGVAPAARRAHHGPEHAVLRQ